MKLRARLLLVTATVVGLLVPAQLGSAEADETPTGSITGTVSATDGTTPELVPGLVVKLWAFDPGTSQRAIVATTDTGADGDYSFDGLPAGTYAVQVRGAACEYADETWYGGAPPQAPGDAGFVDLGDAGHLTLDVPVAVELCNNDGEPQVIGVRRVGSKIGATTGGWNAEAGTLTFAYQWQRVTSANVVTDIPLATANTYVLTAQDVGQSVRVRVTAARTGAVAQPGFSDSSLVGKALSSTGVRLSRTRVHATGRVRLAVAVFPTALLPTGRVSVRIDGRPRVGVTLRTTHVGRATVTLPRLKVGRHRIVARYLGAGWIYGSTSRALRLVVIR